MNPDLDASFSRLAELVGGQSDAFDKIVPIVKEIIDTARLAEGMLRSGKLLYRARINEAGRQFSSKDEISYIRDCTLIKTYGRANRPGRSLFYCSDDAMTAFLETIDSRLRANLNDEGSVTIGCWRVIRPVHRVFLVLNSSDTLLRAAPPESDAGKALRYLSENKDRWDHQLWSKALDYLVTRFAERVTHPRQYQITSAIFDVLIGDEPSGGITYPSVLSEALGINWALLPGLCDAQLKLVDVVRIDFRKEGDSVEIREKQSEYFDRGGRFRFQT
jgi:RES domain